MNREQSTFPLCVFCDHVPDGSRSAHVGAFLIIGGFASVFIE